VISRYERDEMVPSIDAAKKLAGLLGTTVGYLLGESEHDLFKDPEMLKRFKEIKSIGAKEREHILFALDSMLKNIKLKSL
jgi:transcriptional regulator with XRE-family HTH domain